MSIVAKLCGSLHIKGCSWCLFAGWAYKTFGSTGAGRRWRAARAPQKEFLGCRAGAASGTTAPTPSRP
jgi:hypothetical protein